ncbi:hypothetical protein MCUN1_000376 [Malassezia cuniculi]|uniref:Pentatricopeptide repeat-containing protein n=1 Tax=Malassezia cuniculi TaxID=948313 RepID=A0AAF0EVU3_9BASI|nr:hypothetical protein MCUN1_000376 [Malassezia cuniculi]
MRVALPIFRTPGPARARLFSAWRNAPHTWESALEAEDAKALTRTYVPTRKLSEADFKLALSTLVGGNGAASETARQLFDDHIAQHRHSTQALSLGLRACLGKDASATAFEKYRNRFPEWQPTPDDWSAVLEALVERAPLAAVWHHWRSMISAGVQPRTKALDALLVRLFADEQYQGIRRVLLTTGTDQLQVSTLAILVRGACNSHADGMLDEVLRTAGSLLRDALGGRAGPASAWHALLLHDAHVFDWQHMWATAASAISRGSFMPDDETVSTLITGYLKGPELINTADDALLVADRACSATGVAAGKQAYRLLLRHILGPVPVGSDDAHDQIDPGRIHEGVLLYQALRQRHVPADAALVQQLVDALCHAFVPALEPALALLDDVLPKKHRFFSRQSGPTSQAHVAIFCTLLGACARLGALDTAEDLYAKMKEHAVAVDAGRSLLHARMLIRAATSNEDAVRMYRAAASLNSFDRVAYERLLHLFCKLQIDGACPPEHPLEVLGDMRAASFFPSAKTYTVLLDYYAKTPRSSVASVEAIHELIKRDHAVKLDIILINALMNAYNRVGAPSEALNIWSSLVLLSRGKRRYMNDVSLVIICDTCGRANLPNLARRAMRTAAQLDAEPGAPRLVTKDAYDAFVECLARCGAVEEAVEVTRP